MYFEEMNNIERYTTNDTTALPLRMISIYEHQDDIGYYEPKDQFPLISMSKEDREQHNEQKEMKPLNTFLKKDGT